MASCHPLGSRPPFFLSSKPGVRHHDYLLGVRPLQPGDAAGRTPTSEDRPKHPLRVAAPDYPKTTDHHQGSEDYQSTSNQTPRQARPQSITRPEHQHARSRHCSTERCRPRNPSLVRRYPYQYQHSDSQNEHYRTQPDQYFIHCSFPSEFSNPCRHMARIDVGILPTTSSLPNNSDQDMPEYSCLNQPTICAT